MNLYLLLYQSFDLFCILKSEAMDRYSSQPKTVNGDFSANNSCIDLHG